MINQINFILANLATSCHSRVPDCAGGVAGSSSGWSPAARRGWRHAASDVACGGRDMAARVRVRVRLQVRVPAIPKLGGPTETESDVLRVVA